MYITNIIREYETLTFIKDWQTPGSITVGLDIG